jgi:hypothetical protein
MWDFASPTGFYETPHESDTTIHSNRRPIPLPDTPTPYSLPPETQRVSSSGNQLTYGVKPDISHICVFGCEALAYIGKEKRHKLDFKAEKCVYMGISPNHSDDTHKLLRLSTNTIIYRRNVSFNERSFPARTNNPQPTIQKSTDKNFIGNFHHYRHKHPPRCQLLRLQKGQDR